MTADFCVKTQEAGAKLLIHFSTKNSRHANGVFMVGKQRQSALLAAMLKQEFTMKNSIFCPWNGSAFWH